MTVPQMAVEATIKGTLKAIKLEKPANIYESLIDERKQLKCPTEAELKVTKMMYKTWKIRAQRYLKILPEHIKKLNIITVHGRKMGKNKHTTR